MALDHYISQVHLKNFYSPKLGEQMYAVRKTNLQNYTCDARSQSRIEEGSTNPYLEEPRAIEQFLKDVEPVYNSAIDKLRRGMLDAEAVYAIAGFAAYVESCSPAGMRIHAGPLRKSVELAAQALESQGILPPPPPELGGTSLSELLGSGAVQVTVDPKYAQSIGIQTILRRLSIWGNSPWDVILNPFPESPYFTSDYPIGIEIGRDPRVLNRIIPLAPDLAIRIRPDLRVRKDAVDLNFRKLAYTTFVGSRQEVRNINRVIVEAAETTVYYRDDLPWVAQFVRKFSHLRVEPVDVIVPTPSGNVLVSTTRIRERIKDWLPFEP